MMLIHFKVSLETRSPEKLLMYPQSISEHWIKYLFSLTMENETSWIFEKNSHTVSEF